MAKRTSIIRSIIALVVIVGTIVAFIAYYSQHPEVRTQLRHTPLPLLIVLLALYGCFIGSLALINSATLKLTHVTLKSDESLLLTMYSSIINFFGPLQSGPAFRGVYLKTKHKVNLKKYTVATFTYYLFYALFSGLFLISGLVGWFLIPIVLLISVLLWLVSRTSGRLQQIDLQSWYYLAIATLLQVSIQVVIYYLELRSVMPHVTVAQTIVYTGAANFALFVSLTPGAIGFRESFLVFSEKLHHIPNSTIIIANTIDRAAYIVLLLILVMFIFGSQANKRFHIKN